MMPTPPTIAVIGTCDTKLEALRFRKRTIRSTAVFNAILIDVGSYDPSDLQDIDIHRSDVLKEYATTIRNTSTRGEYGHRIDAASGSSTDISGYRGGHLSRRFRLYKRRTKAFRDALPIGFPKLTYGVNHGIRKRFPLCG